MPEIENPDELDPPTAAPIVGTVETVWILGRWIGSRTREHRSSWSVEGIYSTRDGALEHGRKGWFLAPVPLDVPLPPGDIEFPDFEIIE